MRIAYIMAGLFLLLCVMFPLVEYQVRKRAGREKDRIYYDDGKARRGSSLYSFYAFFSSWFLTKRYIRRIKTCMDRYSPGNDRSAAEKTMKVFFAGWGSGVLVVLIILLFTPRFTTVIILLTGIYFLNVATVYHKIEKEEDRLLGYFISYLSDIRHNYQKEGMIEEALEASILEQTPEDMKAHAAYLLDTITDDDMEEKVKGYLENVPNHFFKEFLALCVTVVRFGDCETGGQSLFLTGIQNLKRSINMERLRRKQQRHLFGGYSFIIASPIFSMPLLYQWALSTMPELGKYYNGTYGILTVIGCFITTIILFNLNIRLQEGYQYQENDHALLHRLEEIPFIYRFLKKLKNGNEGKKLRVEQLIRESGGSMTYEQLLLKRLLFAFAALIAANIICLGIHQNTKDNCLNIGNIEFSSVISKEQEKTIQEAVNKFVKKYAGTKIETEKIKQILGKEDSMQYEDLLESCVNDIDARIRKYNNAYYRWYELLLTIVIAAAAYFYPIWILHYEKYLVKGAMLDEVMQFQAVIIILASIPQMTPEMILEWLENFSQIFRMSITKCIDSIQSSEEELMEDIKEKEGFEPFRRLIENLEACDKVGVRAAFGELEAERTYFQEEKKQEGEIQLDNSSALGGFIASIPLFSVITGYLFLPFVIESISQLVLQFVEIKGLF